VNANLCRSMFIAKKVLPTILIGSAVSGFAVMLLCRDVRTSPWFLIIIAFLLLLGLLVWKTASQYADAVIDAGDHLVIRRGRVEDRVQLSDIVEVRGRGPAKRSDIALHLRKPGKFGREVLFLAALGSRNFASAPNDAVENLRRRVGRAKVPHTESPSASSP
jgi:predicted membrane metal-binding protein